MEGGRKALVNGAEQPNPYSTETRPSGRGEHPAASAKHER